MALAAALALQPSMQARPASVRLALFDALDRGQATEDRALVAEALLGRGRVLRVIGRAEEAMRDGEKAIALARDAAPAEAIGEPDEEVRRHGDARDATRVEEPLDDLGREVVALDARRRELVESERILVEDLRRARLRALRSNL